MSKKLRRTSGSPHPDFLATLQFLYEPLHFECTLPVEEPESSEYGACSLKVNGRTVQFRVAKITPTKIGQFVTLWKRGGDGHIQPYDISDSVELFVICVRQEERFGQFVFPREVLCDQDIVSDQQVGGKRGIRVYPPWDKTISPQAKKTQSWQLKYFLPLEKTLDSVRAKSLYCIQ